VIRRLAAGDEPLLQELCRRFKDRVPRDDEAVRFLATDWAAAFVALEDAEPVGFAYGYVLPRIDGATSMFFYELAVAPASRRAGLGRALAEEMRRLAESAGAAKMWVQTDEDNEAAKRTYASAGATRAGGDVLFEWRFSERASTSTEGASASATTSNQT
jgi:ribosomal protein S18 acetylase RimI-like enzyme